MEHVQRRRNDGKPLSRTDVNERFSANSRPRKGFAMKKSRFSDEQIAHTLRLAEAGTPDAEITRNESSSKQTYHSLRVRFNGGNSTDQSLP